MGDEKYRLEDYKVGKLKDFLYTLSAKSLIRSEFQYFARYEKLDFYLFCISEYTFFAIDELWIKKMNDFNPSLGDVPGVGAACQFFISFFGCIEAILPKKNFVIDEFWILQEIKRFQPLLKGCFIDPRGLINFVYCFVCIEK